MGIYNVLKNIAPAAMIIATPVTAKTFDPAENPIKENAKAIVVDLGDDKIFCAKDGNLGMKIEKNGETLAAMVPRDGTTLVTDSHSKDILTEIRELPSGGEFVALVSPKNPNKVVSLEDHPAMKNGFIQVSKSLIETCRDIVKIKTPFGKRAPGPAP